MATAASLRARRDQIVEQYRDNLDLVRQVQKQAVDEVVNSLHAPTSPIAGDDGQEDGRSRHGEDGGADAGDEDARAATTALLRDTGTLFRPWTAARARDTDRRPLGQ